MRLHVHRVGMYACCRQNAATMCMKTKEQLLVTTPGCTPMQCTIANRSEITKFKHTHASETLCSDVNRTVHIEGNNIQVSVAGCHFHNFHTYTNILMQVVVAANACKDAPAHTTLSHNSIPYAISRFWVVAVFAIHTHAPFSKIYRRMCYK